MSCPGLCCCLIRCKAKTRCSKVIEIIVLAAGTRMPLREEQFLLRTILLERCAMYDGLYQQPPDSWAELWPHLPVAPPSLTLGGALHLRGQQTRFKQRPEEMFTRFHSLLSCHHRENMPELTCWGIEETHRRG